MYILYIYILCIKYIYILCIKYIYIYIYYVLNIYIYIYIYFQIATSLRCPEIQKLFVICCLAASTHSIKLLSKEYF